MNTDNNHVILEEIEINSKYFQSKLNLANIVDFLDSTNSIATFIDENIIPEFNNNYNYNFDHENSLIVIDAAMLLGTYGKNKKLKKNELKSFVLILLDLFYNNISYSFVSLNKREIDVRNKSIEFLNSLNHLEIDEKLKIKLLIEFVLNSHEKEKELIKKSVMLSSDQIKKINQVEGKGFSSKVRFILDSYFIENEKIITEEEIISRLNNNIVNIYYKLKEEILKWDTSIELKSINNYIIFSNFYRFLKITFTKNQIKLHLSFSEDKPFDDYKHITRELEVKVKRKELYFTLNNYKEIDYALFLIKQAYENNNQDIYSFTAFNTSIQKIFNKLKKYKFPIINESAMIKNGSNMTKNGLFVLFENGEKFRDMDRIVYIGSNIKKNKLIKMLEYIFKEGDRENTRFRKNIGRILLNKGDKKLFKKFNINYNPKLINIWDMDIKEFNQEYATDSVENKEIKKIEEMVSKHIQENFSFSLIEIEDKFKRTNLKSKIISTLSLSENNKPSKEWLGKYSPRKQIRDSGLYLEHHLFNKENQLRKEDIELLEILAKTGFD
jgi:predicted transport protein